jgi:hypothetical protein
VPPPGTTIGVDTGIRLGTPDAAGLHADLVAAGADVDPEVFRFPGTPKVFSLRDPDGNILYLVQSDLD